MKKQFQNFLIMILIVGYADQLVAQNNASVTWALSSATTTSAVSSGGVSAAGEFFNNTRFVVTRSRRLLDIEDA